MSSEANSEGGERGDRGREPRARGGTDSASELPKNGDDTPSEQPERNRRAARAYSHIASDARDAGTVLRVPLFCAPRPPDPVCMYGGDRARPSRPRLRGRGLKNTPYVSIKEKT